MAVKNALDGKDLTVNIPLDNLAGSIKRVEEAIKAIKEVKIPEFPKEMSIREADEIIVAINDIPEFPINDLKKMLKSIEDGISNIKLEIPEQESIDYEFLGDKFKSLERAVKDISITVSGGGGIGERANLNLDDINLNQTNGSQKTQIFASDSGMFDAFSRLRVSMPYTLLDFKQTTDNLPLFFDDQEVSGGGTSSTWNANQASSTLAVTADTAGHRVRQSKLWGNYQPGKSMLVSITFEN